MSWVTSKDSKKCIKFVLITILKVIYKKVTAVSRGVNLEVSIESLTDWFSNRVERVLIFDIEFDSNLIEIIMYKIR